MTLNIGKWTYTVSHHMTQYAKINGYKTFNDLYFRLNIIIDNKTYIIDKYNMDDNDNLIVDLKLL